MYLYSVIGSLSCTSSISKGTSQNQACEADMSHMTIGKQGNTKAIWHFCCMSHSLVSL
ncbi:unnamed protein product [Brassica rapa subsp. trilocularis]